MGYAIEQLQGGRWTAITTRAQWDEAQQIASEASRQRDAVVRVLRQDVGRAIAFWVAGQQVNAERVIELLDAQLAAARVVAPVEAPSRQRKPKETKDAPEEIDAEAEHRGAPEETKASVAKAQVIKSFPIKVIGIDADQGIVKAIVNVFGIIDDGDDIVHSGAFRKTLAENLGRVRVLDSHNMRSVMSVIGKPLAVREVGRDELKQLAPEILDMHPDATGGLYTETQYLLSTPEGAGAFERIKNGAVSEYSIGFDPVDMDYGKVVDGDGKQRTVRNIRQVRLWEYSPVAWGMNPATATVGVKGQTDTKEYTPDGPVKRIGARLIGAVQSVMVGQIAELLSSGYIDEAEHTVLTELANTATDQLKGGIPDDIGLRPYIDVFDWSLFWSGDGPQELRAAMLRQLMVKAGLAPDTHDAPQAGPSPDASTSRNEAGPQTDETPTDASVLRRQALRLKFEMEKNR